MGEMKTSILTLLLLLVSQGLFAQTFTIDAKGIVKCPSAQVGAKGSVNGIEYEAVDRTLLMTRRDEGADLTKVCTSLVTDMIYMFLGSKFNQPIGNWDVSAVTNMQQMFVTSSFNQPIGNWDVSAVTDMSLMFWNSQFNQAIGNWDVRAVRDMSFMFLTSRFSQPIGNWDVSAVTDMKHMFNGSPFNQPIGDWDVSAVTDMNYMFYSSPFNQPIGDWDVSAVTDMNNMFNHSQFNQPIGDWDVSNVTDMSFMFWISPFNQPIGDWDVSAVTNMRATFGNTPFNQPIGDWDVSAVTDMSFMFVNSQFNQPIGDWDVSAVTGMSYMFSNSPFNQPINLWCVSFFPSEPAYFSTASPLSSQNKPVWGTCPGLPTITALSSPQNNTINHTTRPNFVWAPATNATIYQLQVTEGIDQVVLDTLIISTQLALPKSLKSGTVYNWRVRGINEAKKLTGGWSSIWKFSTGTLTALDDEPLPNGYILSQNFPNPFNPTTQISFTLPRSATVRLEVFNSLGQPVSVVAEGMLSAGAHTYAFDGAALSSGVYLYRLTTPDFVQTRVMALVK